MSRGECSIVQYSTVQYSTVQYSNALDRVQVHTAPSQETGENLSRVDLAVIRVEGSISLATHTPLCLPQPGMEVRGGNVTLAGEQTLETISCPHLMCCQAGAGSPGGTVLVCCRYSAAVQQ